MAEVKSSQNGVIKAKAAIAGLAAAGMGNTTPENKALADALQKALIEGAQIKGITVKVGLPAPGTSGVAEFKVLPWTN